MCDPDLDEILNYLSTKFNKIFYDREFVGIVKEDLQVLRVQKNTCCVLVFPILGSIFSKAVRYQAKILNLAPFYIGTGHKKTLAVCLKEHYTSVSDEDTTKMSDGKAQVRKAADPTAKKRNPRPAQQLYVPPAQRQKQAAKICGVIKKNGTCVDVSSILNGDNKRRSATVVPETCDSNKCDKPSVAKSLEENVRQEMAINCAKDVKESLFSDLKRESVIVDEDCNLSASLSNEAERVALNFKQEPKNQLIIDAAKMEDETDKEKAEMRRATEKINRRSRSIMKYIDNNDILKIEIDTKSNKNTTNEGNLTNWEDLFDDNGELQEPYFGEIVKHVGKEVTILKTSEDYSPYQNKALQDLDHVIELYDFPASFKAHDLVQLYSEIQSDTMYIKWVDDTHALLVLSTPVQAVKALQIDSDLVKSRPMSEASSMSQSVAFKHDLKPAMKRPPTNLHTARRMINTHLGTKSALSKEVMEKERQILKEAREQRRLERQNERDAWDGNPRPSTA